MLRAVACAALVFAATSAGATSLVVTFDGIPSGGATTTSWVEDGVTAVGTIGSFTTLGAVHLDTPGTTSFGGSVDFTTGGLFDPVSIDVLPLASGYCASGSGFSCPAGVHDDPLDYIVVNGFLDGALVGTKALYIPADVAFHTIVLAELPRVDRLQVRVRPYFELGLPGGCDIGAGCGHFDLDNVRLDAVPEPSALALGALALLAQLCRRLYFRMHQSARTPSRQPIFLPSL